LERVPVVSYAGGGHSVGVRGLRRAAFTLIEVLVAVVVLSLGIVAVLRGMSSASVALRAAGETFRTEALSDELLANVAAGLSGGSNAVPPAAGRFTAPDDDYEWEWERRVLPAPAGLSETGVASRALCEVVVSIWRSDQPDGRRTRTRWVYGLASK
jgi:prepilin-type N-terminal cleavage/methylation domain-containing protein